jgi:glycerol-3-phosphate dehydrogenase
VFTHTSVVVAVAGAGFASRTTSVGGAIPEPSLGVYDSDAPAIREIAKKEPALAEKFHPDLPYIGAEVVWAVRAEMARTVEDALARRTRALLFGRSG